jgi:hypothetical protein
MLRGQCHHHVNLGLCPGGKFPGYNARNFHRRTDAGKAHLRHPLIVSEREIMIAVARLPARMAARDSFHPRVSGHATDERAVGKKSHDLLRTVVPETSAKALEVLLATDRWEGELVEASRPIVPRGGNRNGK